jgi:EXLDI family protein
MMPNKTIYVADADLPIFDRAQELAGENLSATIVAALRRFVAAEESQASGYGEVIVKIGENGLFTQKQFSGRELAKLRLPDPQSPRTSVLVVYETAKGRLALYTRTFDDWSAWGRKWGEKQHRARITPSTPNTQDGNTDWSWDWSSWPSQGGVNRLDVYQTVDELREHVPPELHAAVVRALSGNDIELLDI